VGACPCCTAGPARGGLEGLVDEDRPLGGAATRQRERVRCPERPEHHGFLPAFRLPIPGQPTIRSRATSTPSWQRSTQSTSSTATAILRRRSVSSSASRERTRWDSNESPRSRARRHTMSWPICCVLLAALRRRHGAREPGGGWGAARGADPKRVGPSNSPDARSRRIRQPARPRLQLSTETGQRPSRCVAVSIPLSTRRVRPGLAARIASR
jgi:hypothetical protein